MRVMNSNAMRRPSLFSGQPSFWLDSTSYTAQTCMLMDFMAYHYTTGLQFRWIHGTYTRQDERKTSSGEFNEQCCS